MRHDETLEFPRSVDEPVLVYKDPYTLIERYKAQFSDFEKTFYVSRKGVRAAIIPIHENKVLLTRQYRFLVNEITLEVIGGRVDDNENPIDAAQRECLEETGHLCEEIEPLIKYLPGLDTYDNPTHVFISHNVHSKIIMPEGVFEWIPLEKIQPLIYSGKLYDSLSLIALSTYLLRNPIIDGIDYDQN